MTPQQKSKVQEIKAATIEGMVSYMKFGGAESEGDPDYDPTFDPGYTQKHVDDCAKIIDAYLDALERMRGTREDQMILSEAKRAVLSLNVLNDECDGSLIETDQREQICELMIVAAKYAGLAFDGDFTEDWREW